MPLEILESVIRVNILDDKSSSDQEPNAPSADTRLLVKECVEQVLEILKEREER